MRRQKQTTPDMQRRQLVIEEPLNGGDPILTLRWDEHSQPLGALEGWTMEQAKRYGVTVQLGRNEHEIGWTFNEFGSYRVWYSDTVLTLNGGIRPTASQIAASRGRVTRKACSICQDGLMHGNPKDVCLRCNGSGRVMEVA